MMSLLGPSLVVRGEVLAYDDLAIEGQVEGPVWAEGQVVTVAEHAVVTGNIVGRDITVSGTVDGTLLAVEVVDIRSTGRVTGRIVAERLILAEGGVFNGRAEPHQVEAAMRVARHRRK